MNPINANIGDIREYLIVINFPSCICQDIIRFKRESLNLLNRDPNIKSTPHITMSQFVIQSTPEKTIKKELIQYLEVWRPFKIQLLNFDKFNSIIYVKPYSSEIIKLQHYLITILRKKVKVSSKFAVKLNSPHVTIVRELSTTELNKCWDYFKRKYYTNEFVVDKLVVLAKNYSLKEEKFRIAFEVDFKA